jgi:hypothetical protein
MITPDDNPDDNQDDNQDDNPDDNIRWHLRWQPERWHQMTKPDDKLNDIPGVNL